MWLLSHSGIIQDQTNMVWKIAENLFLKVVPQLTACTRVIFEKLIFAQPFKLIRASHAICIFITSFERSYHWPSR
jgi:hypothetical protein